MRCTKILLFLSSDFIYKNKLFEKEEKFVLDFIFI